LQAIRPTRPSFEPHDLNEIIEESVAFLRREIEDRDILVETDLAAGLPRVEVDRDQMKQAFYNVIKNAFEAMRTGGILHIRSWRDDNFVSIAFTDTGGGLSAEDMSKLFRPYFTTKSSGSGLGLLIVRRIVREHGGEIEIESNQGKGVRVTIHLPYGEKRTRLLSDRNDAANESAEPTVGTGGQSTD
jgi:two-component system, sporulation sensor kinase E